jgi:hypothetical protein
MFMLPAYDATALAMLGFGILAAGAFALGFWSAPSPFKSTSASKATCNLIGWTMFTMGWIVALLGLVAMRWADGYIDFDAPVFWCTSILMHQYSDAPIFWGTNIMPAPV